MKTKEKAFNKMLLWYAAILVAMCTVVQITSAIRGSRLDGVDMLMLAVVFVYYMYFHFVSYKTLSKVRFGRLVAHVIGFLIVNLSFHLHAAIMLIAHASGSGELAVSLSPEWFGVLFGMFIVWGAGLLAHLVISVTLRGYEELKA